MFVILAILLQSSSLQASRDEGKLPVFLDIVSRPVQYCPVMLVTGGYPDGGAVEVVSGAGAALACSLPPLPAPRQYHTQVQVINNRQNPSHPNHWRENL